MKGPSGMTATGSLSTSHGEKKRKPTECELTSDTSNRRREVRCCSTSSSESELWSDMAAELVQCGWRGGREGERTTEEENERNGTRGEERKGRSKRGQLTVRKNYLCCQLAMATTQLRCRDYLPRVSKTTSKTGGVRSRVSHKDIRSNKSLIRCGINPLGMFKRVESSLTVEVAVGSR